jgi:SAM-dependent methyltransferase
VLAELEASILVADISPVQLALNRQHAREYGFAQSVEDWQLADICDLSRFAAGSFDCVVAYGGPLSYVLEQRETALRECARVLRTGGVFLASVMSLWGTGHAFFDSVMTIPVECNRKIVASGDQLPTTFPEARHYLHLFRVGEFRDLLSKTGLTVVALSASNCLSTRWQDLLQTIRTDEEKWNELLRLEVEACAQEGCQGMGTHLIGIGQKI